MDGGGGGTEATACRGRFTRCTDASSWLAGASTGGEQRRESERKSSCHVMLVLQAKTKNVPSVSQRGSEKFI